MIIYECKEREGRHSGGNVLNGDLQESHVWKTSRNNKAIRM